MSLTARAARPLETLTRQLPLPPEPAIAGGKGVGMYGTIEVTAG